MNYTEKKYLVDCLKHNFKFTFDNENQMVFFDLDGSPLETVEIIYFLVDEYGISQKDALQTIVRWTQGDVHADMMDYIDNEIDTIF